MSGCNRRLTTTMVFLLPSTYTRKNNDTVKTRGTASPIRSSVYHANYRAKFQGKNTEL